MTTVEIQKRQVIRADAILDCTGLLCPMPIAQTALKMRKMAGGQVLEVISDDTGIKDDMPAWCRATGNEFLGVGADGDSLRVYVRKVAP